MMLRFALALCLAIAAQSAEASEKTMKLPASPQRSGDPQRGYQYLVEGDYITSGPPLALYRMLNPEAAPNVLQRTGDNAALKYSFTASTAANGVRIVTPNCLSCHAQYLNGQFILGLGDSLSDFTVDRSPRIAAGIDQLLVAMAGPESREREAFARFRDVSMIIGPQIRTPVRGVNAADKLAYILAAHRDPQTLRWQDKPHAPLPPAEENIPTDVPPWWVLKKKHAMFYTGIGRGDFARIMMASSLLTINGVEEAANIDARFADVLAYLNTIQPPKYPGEIDTGRAARGRQVFENRCAKCHGSYDEQPEYPNLLVALEEIRTDPLLAEATHTTYAAAREAYNRSWFSIPPHAAQLISDRGYVAPPLDGIWATAPYLHNAAVPDLETLLDSARRPTYWRRSFRADDYDLQKVGWRYESLDAPDSDVRTYDTTRPGYGNSGHNYGDTLNADDRRALIEYLKSL